MPFALDVSPTSQEMAEAINYLLANFGPNLSADPNTGQIAGPQGIVVGYLYRYMSIKYSDSLDGSLNFSNVPTNRLYYGIRNSDDSTESTNPADYIWFKVAGGGFSTTKFLFYQTTGGRAIQFVVSTTKPANGWAQDSGTAIDLDIITAVLSTAAATPTIYQWTGSSTPPARPTTTTTYTWSTASYTAPSGWAVTPPSNTTPGAYLWAITIPIVADSTTTTTTLDWTNVSYAIRAISYNGTDGEVGPNGLNALTAYLVQSQSASAPSGFPQTTTGSTAPSGWSLTAPSVSVGQVLWYSQGQFNNSTVTIDGIAANTTYWNNPVAASIFQDIRSDNWNGSNPPALTPTNSATWGTAGYYIERSTGYMYLNSLYARGAAKFNGTNTVGSDTFALVANQSLNTSGGIVSYSASIFNGAMMGYGSGSAFGGYFQTTGSQAALACSTSGSGPALQVNGRMTITNNTLVTNLNADLLDGNHASAFLAAGGTAYAADRLNGSAGTNVLRFVQGTTSGSATASFPGNNKPGSSSSAVWIQITIDSTTLYIPAWT